MNAKNLLTDAFFESIKKAILRPILERKIGETGVSMSPDMLDSLTDHILSGRTERFTWSDGTGHPDRSIALTFTNDDTREVEEGIAKVTAALPDIFADSVRTTAQEVFKSLHRRWPAERLRQEQELFGFQQRLGHRWDKGLSNLCMLLTCSREIGHEVLKRHDKSKSKRQKYRRWVMARLHARACQVTDEIICLLQNGFADGAMARWRTLHEISIVAILITDGDEDLAERYILHDAVEVERQIDGYDEVQKELGLSGTGKGTRAAIKRAYDAAVRRFGPEFRQPYGWAAKHLNHRKPTFKELQEAADRSTMRNDYKAASFNVHASARSLFFSLSTMGTGDPLATGRSNAGLEEPGKLTAYTITLITTLYIGNTSNLERLTETATLIHLRNAATEGFAKASRRLLWETRTPQDTLA